MGITSIKQEPVDEEGDKSGQRVQVMLVIPESQRKAVMEGLVLIQIGSDLLRLRDERPETERNRGDDGGSRERRESHSFIENRQFEYLKAKKNSNRCDDKMRNVKRRAIIQKSNHQSRQLNGSSVRSHKMNTKRNK